MTSEAAKERIRKSYPDILRAAEVAELLRINVRTVLNMAHDGRLAGHRLPGGRHVVFYREDVLALLDDHVVSNEAEDTEKESAND